MKIHVVITAALLAALVALPSQAREPQQPAASLILAQARGDAQCKLEGRSVPQGTSHCEAGYIVRCNARGSWEKTGKRC
jgi:hypothetical protein